MSKKNLAIVLSVLYIPPLCLLDIVTGSDLSLMVLYLLPVGACAYYAGKGPAAAVSALALAAWLVADFVMPYDIDIPKGLLIALGSAEKAIVFGGLIVLVLKIKAYIEAERARALRDPVTGLLNRRAFDSALARALGSSQPFCLAFIEIEGLEDFDLDRGEAFVEALLKRMAEAIRSRMAAYRHADRRFAVLLPQARGSEASERISALLEEIAPRGEGGERLALAFKAGIARVEDAASVPPPQLLRRLQGCMIHLRGKEGDQVEAFEYR